MGIGHVLELVPADRHRHRRTAGCTGGIGHHCSAAMLVEQPVDENFPLRVALLNGALNRSGLAMLSASAKRREKLCAVHEWPRGRCARARGRFQDPSRSCLRPATRYYDPITSPCRRRNRPRGPFLRIWHRTSVVLGAHSQPLDLRIGRHPWVMAQLLSTPSTPSRKSQWSRVASCFCTINRLPPLFPCASSAGSGVFVKSRRTNFSESGSTGGLIRQARRVSGPCPSIRPGGAE